ncbi:unnamed protein product [Rhizophagus irregularis]|uniref:Ion transport domain-containing protein n=1 Tax=Rhizophagus irregularis TaxID=588596 RepID=A0A916EGH9_9GLOM|nr:unnamed protein product [Rhizophagus irregularis]CAB5389571.1 unnamed protein product [Rhizophagus irregularis]
MYENFDNDLGKSPLALRVFPLPSFTISDIKKEDNYNWKIIIKNLFWFIFMPRLYKIGRNGRNKLSPFSRMILYENNDDIYDKPATEAYYLAIYQFTTEIIQLIYCGFKKYIGEIFNIFDVISIILSVTVMSIMLKSFQFSGGFESVKEIDDFLSPPNTRFVSLRNPTNIKTKDSTYSGNATNISTNETFNIELKSDFDPTSRDNPFTSFSEAIIATYF